MPHDSLENLLRQRVTRGRVLTAPAQLAGYDADGLGYKTFRPDAVVIPADADELVRLLQVARSLGVPISLRGAGTSLSGGPVAAQGGVVVHPSALRQVRHICPEGFWCEVECGVTLHQLDEQLRPYGLFYPPDPSSGPVCTLGGNVAMNAGGAHCFRYGVTGNYVLGVEAVLIDGSVHRFGGPGGGRGPWREDWKRLMIGSEGTLAAFTRFWLRLLPRPESAWTFRATYPDLVSAERAIHAIAAHPSYAVAIELMDPRCVAMVENSPMAAGLPRDCFLLLTEIDGPQTLVNMRVESIATLLREAGASDVAWSDNDEQRNRLWRARKVAGGLMGQLSPDLVVQDAVIPKRALADLLSTVYEEADAAGIPVVNVFHAGDGNLHPNFLFDSRRPGELEKVERISQRLMQRVVDVGGTLSGEHGIGNDKTAYMPLVFGPLATRMQLAVASAFNPEHQFNPLKVFSARRYGVPQASGGPAKGARSVLTPQRDADRCFQTFIDPIDGVMCTSAEATFSELQAQAAPLGLRFPLILDAERPLREQVASSGYAPASSRFGPYCDNIIGMNWKLPDDRVVRIGERVAKTTTGYDLLRFLLAGSSAWGRAVEYVLRLRRLCEYSAVVSLTGAAEAVAAGVPRLLQNSWMHWFDSIDLIVDHRDPVPTRLRIMVNCPRSEWTAYETFLDDFAASGLLEMHIDGHPPIDGCPDFVMKTSPERLVTLTQEVAADGIRCVGLCYNAVVHGYLPESGERTQRTKNLVERYAVELQATGGHWQSRHLPPVSLSETEAGWVSLMDREFRTT